MTYRFVALAGITAIVGFSAPTPSPVPAATAPVPATAAAAPVVSAPAPVVNPIEAAVESALSALAPHVRRMSHENALRTAFRAYFNFKAEHGDEIRKPYLYFVDYGLDNRTARGYVFNMDELKLIDGPFMVAHGRGSSAGKNAVPMRFTNQPGSASTSLGLYVAEETYGFSGKSGGRHYNSIGLRMDGKSGRFNSTARARGVVAHGAPYVTSGGSGRSEGCPAMEEFRARKLIPMISKGGVVFLYSPNDTNWLQNDPWVNGAVQ